jgi:very-short-patch-repair endonuclease
VFLDRVEETLASIELNYMQLSESPPIATFVWEKPPRIDDAIDVIIRELAEAAMVCHRDWTDFERNVDGARWYGRANELVQRNQLPLPTGCSNATNAQNLCKLISPDPLIVLAVTSDFSVVESMAPHIDGLCRAANWLATNARVRVAMLMHRSLDGHDGLSSIDFAPLRWPDLTPTTVDQLERRATAFSDTFSSVPQVADRQERKLLCWPIVGRPHPLSPGEQLLAKALEADRELAGRFQFNQIITTDFETRYLVDLYSDSDHLIVEIDGYRYHSSETAFKADRLRDFHLVVSGYLVVRIPHDDVIHNLHSALERIRRAVDFRQRKSGSSGYSKVEIS